MTRNKPIQTTAAKLIAMPSMVKLVLISKRWRNKMVGGALRSLRPDFLSRFVRGTRRCPDGQKPHPFVCHRGWRGDVCQGCIAFRY